MELKLKTSRNLCAWACLKFKTNSPHSSCDDFRLWLNKQQCYDKTDGTGGFNTSNRSKTNPSRCSDCRLVMLYKVVKKLWAEFLSAEFGILLDVAQEPRVLWRNGDYSRIFLVRLV